MRNKKMAKRIAVAMLAAATTFSSVPAASVFAQTISVEQSDAAAVLATNAAITKNDEVQDTSDHNGEAYKLLDAVQHHTEAPADPAGKNAWKAAFQTAVNGVSATTNHTYQISDTTFEKTGDASGSVTFTDSDNNTWVVTFTTVGKLADSSDTNDKALANALDDFFAGNTFYSYEAKTITPASVKAKLIDSLSDTAKGLGKALNDAGVTTSDASTKINVQSATVSTDGSTVTGRILFTTTGSASGAYYDYSSSLVANEDTQKNVVKSAISEVEKTPYANPIDFTSGKVVADGGNSTELATAIKNALNKQLEGTGEAVGAVSGTVDKATRTTDGSYTANINGNNLSVTLKYSSAEKMADQITAIKKAFKAQGAKDDAALHLADSANAANASATAVAANYQYQNQGTNNVAGILKFGITSSLSKTLQPTKALKSVKKDDVKAAVLDAVKKAVTDAGYDSDGVTYKAEVVDKFSDGVTTTNTTWATADGTHNATKTAGGQYLIKVTGSIKNDYSNWGVTEESAAAENTKEAVYYVIVNTNKLDSKKADSLSLADQTLVQKRNYTSSVDPSGDGSFTTHLAENSTAIYADVFDLKAVLTPSDSNDDLTWAVEPADDKTSDKGAAVALTTVGIGATLSQDSKVVFNAADSTKTITASDGKLIVFAPGKYKVTVTDSDTNEVAEATITVASKFKDVRPGAYYEGPVNRAYVKGVTSGTSEDTFGVNDDVTRAQFVTWLYKTAVAKDSTQAIADEDLKAVFSDVSTDKFYAKAVQWAVANKITAGTSATTFSPDQTITRAQAVTMLWNYVGKEDTGTTGSEDDNTKRFTDLPSNKVFAAAITWAVNNHITSGTTLTTFSPDTTATRAQAITFIDNAGLFR